MEEADLSEESADPGDVNTVKLAIAKQVVDAYQIHRKRYARATKTPGTAFYKTLTNDVFLKYKHCFKTVSKSTTCISRRVTRAT